MVSKWFVSNSPIPNIANLTNLSFHVILRETEDKGPPTLIETKNQPIRPVLSRQHVNTELTRLIAPIWISFSVQTRGKPGANWISIRCTATLIRAIKQSRIFHSDKYTCEREMVSGDGNKEEKRYLYRIRAKERREFLFGVGEVSRRRHPSPTTLLLGCQLM